MKRKAFPKETKPLTEKTPKSVRVRLMLAIPLVFALFTIASGWLALNLSKYFFLSPARFSYREGEATMWVLMAILLMTALAAFSGAILAHYISKPLKKVSSRIETLLSGRLLKAPDELALLSTAMDEVFTSLDRYIKEGKLMEALPEGVVTLDRHGMVIHVNKTAQRVLGVSSEEAEGKHIVYTFGDSQGNKIFLNLINNALQKGDTQVFEDMEVPSKRGTLRLRGRISPKSEAGTFSGAIITFQDPSEVEQIRGWLKQADQMAGLGTMAAGIAHEIRNPLASIRGLMELLREDIVETDPKRKYVDTVINEVDRVNKLVQEVLDFAQVETTEPEARDINELIEQALIITKHRLPDKAIEVVEDLAKNLPSVFVRPDKITQAFENILVNAFEATPEGGKVVVTSGLEPFPSRTKNEKYRNVLVRFSNTGSFIAPENIEKIFLPFYTTKPGGTGLGLPICHRIISSLGGEIRVESHGETGTTFEIELPTASWIFKK